MAGLKHIDLTAGRADQACGEIRGLTPDEVEQTLEFIYSLTAQRQTCGADLGRPEKLLEHRNRWSFNEGERVRLLDELRILRGDG